MEGILPVPILQSLLGLICKQAFLGIMVLTVSAPYFSFLINFHILLFLSKYVSISVIHIIESMFHGTLSVASYWALLERFVPLSMERFAAPL